MVQLPGRVKHRPGKSAPRCPQNLRAEFQANTCRQMFTAALVTKAKRRKQPSCPSPDEWANRMWTLHGRKDYSAMRRKDALTQAKHGGTLTSSRREKEARPGNHVLFDSVHAKEPGQSIQSQKAGGWLPGEMG